MNTVEMVMRRRVFRAFVKADPVSVSFERDNPPTRTAAGGLVPGGTTILDPQQGRIVQTKRRYDAGLVNAEAGEIPDSDYLLLGYHTMDVQKSDRFTWAGNWYRVTGVHPTRTESKLCAIEFDGPVNTP